MRFLRWFLPLGFTAVLHFKHILLPGLHGAPVEWLGMARDFFFLNSHKCVLEHLIKMNWAHLQLNGLCQTVINSLFVPTWWSLSIVQADSDNRCVFVLLTVQSCNNIQGAEKLKSASSVTLTDWDWNRNYSSAQSQYSKCSAPLENDRHLNMILTLTLICEIFCPRNE